MANDWSIYPISDFVTLSQGLAINAKSKYLLEETGLPLLRITDLINGTQVHFVNEEKAPPKCIATDHELIYTRTGQVGLVYRNKVGVVHNNCFKVIPSPELDKDFLYWFLFQESTKAHVNAVASGSVQKDLNHAAFLTLEIPKPELSEQKAIASILDSIDNKIELNRQISETLEAMAQALFKSWFVNFDPVIDNALAAGNAIPDEFLERAEQRKRIEKKDNSEIQALFPDEFEFTEEMGWIPKGWTVSNVGTEFDVTMGQSPPGSTYNELEEGIYFFQGSTDFGFRYPTPRIYCTEPKRLANKRDTLVSVRAPVGDTNLAAVDCCIGRGLAALRHKSGSASFTYYAMLQLKENFKIYEGEGTVFGSINQKDFKNLVQLKSPEILISEFEINAGALDSKIELNSLNIITLAKLRDTLLPKLMSGELRIPDAEKLVENI